MTKPHDTEAKVATSLPPGLKHKLKAMADETGLTLAAYTRRILIAHIREKIGSPRVRELLETKSLTDKSKAEPLGPASTPPPRRPPQAPALLP